MNTISKLITANNETINNNKTTMMITTVTKKIYWEVYLTNK